MKLLFIEYILNQLVKINNHGYFSSITAATKISLMMSPFVYLSEKVFSWGLENQAYIYIVLGAILVDWFFGSIKHLFFTRTFSLKRNSIGLVLKIALVVGAGFLFEGLAHLTTKITLLEEGLGIITKIVVFMYPAVSAWENIYVVSEEKFPPKKWMERITKYKESSDIDDLLDKK